MRYTVTIAALLLIAAVNGPLDAGRDRAAEADSLIQAAADTSLDKGERIRLLKRATGRDRTGKAMHTLSRLYMSLNSPAEASALGKNLGLNSPEHGHVFKSSMEDELQHAAGPCGEC